MLWKYRKCNAIFMVACMAPWIYFGAVHGRPYGITCGALTSWALWSYKQNTENSHCDPAIMQNAMKSQPYGAIHR